MKTIALAALAFAATPSPSRSMDGFVIHESVTFDGKDAGWTRTSIAFGKVRREKRSFTPSVQDGSTEVTLLDPTSETPVVSLFPSVQYWRGLERRTFDAGSEPGPFLEGLGVSEEDELVVPARPFRPTGRTEKIGEWVAQEYVSVVPGPANIETRLWLAPTPAGLPDDAILSVAERVYARPGNAFVEYFRGMRALPGFPVRTVVRFELGGNMTEVVSTVTSIARKPVSAGAFEIPAGYQRAPERRVR